MMSGNEALFIYGVQQVIFSTPWTVALVIFLARWLILANVFFVLYFLSSKNKKDRQAVTEVVWSLIFALVMTTVVAYFVGRDRPFAAFSDISLLIPPPFNTSFPSGHTAAALAVALAILYRNRLAGSVSLLITAAVAFGRLASGVHYPSDLLGGAFVGLLVFVIVRFLHRELGSDDIVKSAKRHMHK